MAKFKVSLTDYDGVLISSYEIDSNEMNWNTQPMKHLFAYELFDEMERYIHYNSIDD